MRQLLCTNAHKINFFTPPPHPPRFIARILMVMINQLARWPPRATHEKAALENENHVFQRSLRQQQQQHQERRRRSSSRRRYRQREPPRRRSGRVGHVRLFVSCVPTLVANFLWHRFLGVPCRRKLSRTIKYDRFAGRCTWFATTTVLGLQD